MFLALKVNHLQGTNIKKCFMFYKIKKKIFHLFKKPQKKEEKIKAKEKNLSREKFRRIQINKK